MTQDEYIAHWRCSECKTEYVVPILARDCETRHEEISAQLKAVG